MLRKVQCRSISHLQNNLTSYIFLQVISSFLCPSCKSSGCMYIVGFPWVFIFFIRSVFLLQTHGIYSKCVPLIISSLAKGISKDQPFISSSQQEVLLPLFMHQKRSPRMAPLQDEFCMAHMCKCEYSHKFIWLGLKI